MHGVRGKMRTLHETRRDEHWVEIGKRSTDYMGHGIVYKERDKGQGGDKEERERGEGMERKESVDKEKIKLGTKSGSMWQENRKDRISDEGWRWCQRWRQWKGRRGAGRMRQEQARSQWWLHLEHILCIWASILRWKGKTQIKEWKGQKEERAHWGI